MNFSGQLAIYIKAGGWAGPPVYTKSRLVKYPLLSWTWGIVTSGFLFSLLDRWSLHSISFCNINIHRICTHTWSLLHCNVIHASFLLLFSFIYPASSWCVQADENTCIHLNWCYWQTDHHLKHCVSIGIPRLLLAISDPSF